MQGRDVDEALIFFDIELLGWWLINNFASFLD